MKSLVLAALTGAALVLSGCATSDTPNDTVTTSVEPFQSESNSGFTAIEDEFLYDVSEHMTPRLHNEPQADVLALGYAICAAFDNGAEVEDIVPVSMEAGVTYTDSIVIAASAVVNLCPEHRNNGSVSNMT